MDANYKGGRELEFQRQALLWPAGGREKRSIDRFWSIFVVSGT
jgi:hypothetical protein